MAEPNKPNTFVLFRNDKKTSDNQPDFRGRATDENGTDWELSAWVKSSKAGSSYIGGTLRPPYTQPAASADDFLTPTAAPAQAAEPLTFDSSKQPTGDLPF